MHFPSAQLLFLGHVMLLQGSIVKLQFDPYNLNFIVYEKNKESSDTLIFLPLIAQAFSLVAIAVFRTCDLLTRI